MVAVRNTTFAFGLLLAIYQMPDLSTTVSDDTFMLILQTKQQELAYREHASKLLCLDSTHGTNQYRFYVQQAVVSDSHGEGINFYEQIRFLKTDLIH